MITVIMRFKDESYLLPWWIAHHKGIVDNCILIDADSTDESADICRALAPEWDLRRSRVPGFNANAIDAEIMEIEREVGGWKIFLTTTEFLLTSRPLAVIVDECYPSAGIRTKAVGIIDTEREFGIEPDPSRPLLAQRHHGHFDDPGVNYHSRLLHRYDHGDYSTGRHGWNVDSVETTEVATVWLQYAPMTPEGIKRKVQIGPQVPQSDKDCLFSCQHWITHATTESTVEAWRGVLPKTRDLSQDDWYSRLLKNAFSE